MATLINSWRIRRNMRIDRRLGMTVLVAGLKLGPVERMLVNYSVGTRLNPSWRVIGTGKEQITCAVEANAGQVNKIIISSTADDPDELTAVAERYAADARVVQSVLGPFDLETTYSVQALDDAKRRFGVVGNQRRLKIVDSVFHHGGSLSPRAKDLPLSVRHDLVERVRRLHADSGYLVDVLGIGNLVFAEECPQPVLIDNIPLDPLVMAKQRARDGRTFHDEVQSRLDRLLQGS